MPNDLIHFGLIVTGEGEREFLPSLFRNFSETGKAVFYVIAKTGQLAPITSPIRQIQMVGRGNTIPSKDIEKIGLPARNYLNQSSSHCVLVIDDLEQSQRDLARQKFDRYRLAVDTVLIDKPEYKTKVAVHFLVNMLEAYFFTDINAINEYVGFPSPLEEFIGDVEEIPHPKNILKTTCNQQFNGRRGYDEKVDGEHILARLRPESLLIAPNTCAWLRTLFAWCYEKIVELHFDFEVNKENLDFLDAVEEEFPDFVSEYHLNDGIYSDVTKPQLQYFGRP